MQTSNTTPTTDDLARFFKPVEADTRVPVIEKEALSDGVLLKFLATRDIKTRSGASVLHRFATVGLGTDSVEFAIWGTGELNNQMRKVTPGAVVFLSYRGKRALDDSETAIHTWVVNVARTPVDKLPEDFVRSLEPHRRRLETTVEVARAAESERMRRNDTSDGGYDGYMEELARSGR